MQEDRINHSNCAASWKWGKKATLCKLDESLATFVWWALIKTLKQIRFLNYINPRSSKENINLVCNC